MKLVLPIIAAIVVIMVIAYIFIGKSGEKPATGTAGKPAGTGSGTPASGGNTAQEGGAGQGATGELSAWNTTDPCTLVTKSDVEGILNTAVTMFPDTGTHERAAKDIRTCYYQSDKGPAVTILVYQNAGNEAQIMADSPLNFVKYTILGIDTYWGGGPTALWFDKGTYSVVITVVLPAESSDVELDKAKLLAERAIKRMG